MLDLDLRWPIRHRQIVHKRERGLHKAASDLERWIWPSSSRSRRPHNHPLALPLRPVVAMQPWILVTWRSPGKEQFERPQTFVVEAALRQP